MIYPESELRKYTELCPPSFPRTLPIDTDPASYAESLALYKKAVEDAMIIQGHGTTIFKGGPLDYESRGIKDAWLTPAIVQDEKGFSAIHMIHLNGSTWDNPGLIQYSATIDADLLLENTQSPAVQGFHDFLDPSDTTPRTLVRMSSNGNTFYPYIHGARTQEADVLANRLATLSKVIGHEIPVTDEDLFAACQSREVIGRVDGFDVITPHLVDTAHGTFLLYGLVNPDDPWQYYEILTPRPLEDIDPNVEVFMRLDSGCDTGQCYLDEGCECRAQLHEAMEQAVQNNGMVLLVPEHDGRGYGLVTKLLTEGAKQGVPMGYNDEYGHPLDTIEAAKALLGKKYDIRTFEGTANILIALGITRVQLFTDNVPKTRYLQEAGIEVVRIPTKTKTTNGNSKLDRHLGAKHAEGDLYFNTEQESL